ncbi:PIN domain-containing protein [Paenibacillus polymyxa]|uniref:PIN domain-containing protein n=1 Tax=Paenibacillus polymyxa TaxID=1406 RepID=UPI001F0CE925|nr:PIN domain-containing protein [Paenibacillus polymyxa]UMR33684.1 PIN domain-containing protein [Paenibacillus polymyxa]
MKDIFPMYYAPANEEFDEMWKESIIVFDANVLLNLYRYSIKTSDLILDIMDRLSDRLWIPYQVALEYQANRQKVIYEQKEAYTQVKNVVCKEFEEMIDHLSIGLKKYYKRHPIIETANITTKIENLKSEVIQELEEQELKHPNYNEDDKIRSFIDKHFDGKIGTPYSETELSEIYREGEQRYKSKRPPGYKDMSEKKDQRRFHKGLIIESQYGDLIVWKQILDMAQQKNKSVILITDDNKEDWWQRESGKTIGPRVELTDEFTQFTKQKFYMYESYKFIEYAQNFLNQQVDKEAIREAQNLKYFSPTVKYFSPTEWSEDDVRKLLEEVDEYNNDPYNFSKLNKLEKPTEYSINELVRHHKWGIGSVVNVRGKGSYQEVKIQFPEPYGLKRLLSAYAPLEKVSFFDAENHLLNP